jgi:hypothetical protein
LSCWLPVAWRLEWYSFWTCNTSNVNPQQICHWFPSWVRFWWAVIPDVRFWLLRDIVQVLCTFWVWTIRVNFVLLH